MAALLLGGCLGGAGDPAPTPTGPRIGAAEGQVVDDEGRPVAGAQVRAMLRETSTLADAQGNYRLENLTAGALRLVASAQGHASQTRDLELGEGVVARVDFAVRRLPSVTPRSDTETFTGRIECGLVQGTSCETATGANANTIRFDVDPALAGIVVEVAWTPTAPGTASALRAELRAATADACGLPYAEASGPSILRVEAREGFPLHGGPQCLRVGLASDAVAVSQDFEAHVSLFYHAPPPAGFSAVGRP